MRLRFTSFVVINLRRALHQRGAPTLGAPSHKKRRPSGRLSVRSGRRLSRLALELAPFGKAESEQANAEQGERSWLGELTNLSLDVQ